MSDTSQTTLLRVAAFLVDALSISIVLIVPASALSYILAWLGGQPNVAAAARRADP